MSIDLSKMPKLGFGLMRLPEKDGVIDHEQVCQMVDLYMNAGLTYFDTAYTYMNGGSEAAIRDTLTDRYPREAFLLADKLSPGLFEKEEDIRPVIEDQLQTCGVEG